MKVDDPVPERSSLKVLYLITVLAPAGAERSLVAMAPSLRDLGVKVHVAYLRERPGLHGELERVGIGVTSLSGRGGAPARFLRTLRLIRHRRPDVVHTTLTEANTIGRLAGLVAGVPVVSSLVNTSYGPEQRRAPGASAFGVRLRQLIDLATARRVVRFHAVTTPVADVMARRLHVPRDRIGVVPRGRDAEALGRRTSGRRAAIRSALEVPDDVALVVSVAHQDYQKGLDVLIEALGLVRAKGRDLRLVVAGRQGNQTEALAALVARLGLGEVVHFLGLRHDVPELLCGADVFVLASRWEGMGGVLLEAMAMEVPIVVSDLATLRDAVPDERYARFAAPEQAEAFAAAITEVLDDPTGAAERTAAARQRFGTDFGVARVAEGMLGLYRDALAARGPVRRSSPDQSSQE